MVFPRRVAVVAKIPSRAVSLTPIYSNRFVWYLRDHRHYEETIIPEREYVRQTRKNTKEQYDLPTKPHRGDVINDYQWLNGVQGSDRDTRCRAT